MTDQQPVEPDAIVDRDGAAVPYRRAEDNAAPPTVRRWHRLMGRGGSASLPLVSG